MIIIFNYNATIKQCNTLKKKRKYDCVFSLIMHLPTLSLFFFLVVCTSFGKHASLSSANYQHKPQTARITAS